MSEGKLQDAIKTLVELFVQYADGDGKLSPEEFKKMVENETTCPDIKAKMASGEMAKCMGKAGKRCDGGLRVGQYGRFVGKMVRCAYKKHTGREEPEEEDD